MPLVSYSRSSYRRTSLRAGADKPLRERLLELASERPRYGYRRLHVFLKREGLKINRKRVFRLYRDLGLAVRRKKRKRVAQANACLESYRSAPTSSGRWISCATRWRVVGCFARSMWSTTQRGNAWPSRSTLRFRVAASVECSTRSLGSAVATPAACPRQRAGVHQQSAGRMGLPARRDTRLHPARQTGRELFHRELQRQVSRRVPQSPLVSWSGRRSPPNRDLATRLQLRPAAQHSGRRLPGPRGPRGATPADFVGLRRTSRKCRDSKPVSRNVYSYSWCQLGEQVRPKLHYPNL